MAQRVTNLPAVRETWVQSPSQEDPLEKGLATHSSILAWRIPWKEEPGGLHTVHGVAESWTQLTGYMLTLSQRIGVSASHPLLPPSPPVLNLSQHQGLFQ